jgi:hypothetical protein
MQKGALGNTGTCIHLRMGLRKASGGTHYEQTTDINEAVVGTV